jgi:uncharacterized cupin superfamily protein
MRLDDLGGGAWEAYPQKAILSGDMQSRVAYLRDDDGNDPGKVRISFFRAEPSVSQTTFKYDETIYIVEGVADVVIDGETMRLEAGVAAHFDKGADAELRVHEAITMFVVDS